MKEKFSDYEGGFLQEEGEFVFEITDAELKQSKKGDDMVELTAKCIAGTTILRHSLLPKARWSYNNLIKACLHLNTREKIEAFECDYQTIHNELIGKKFKGTVKEERYNKETKIPLDDGTFETQLISSVSYKVTAYAEA